MKERCKGKGDECNACAYTIAQLFARYERQVEMVLETVLREVALRRSKDLADAKREITGARSQAILEVQESLKV